MFLTLPILAYGLLFHFVRQRFAESRTAALAAAVLWASCLVAITEILSLFNRITRSAVTLAWVLVSVLTFVASRKFRLPRTPAPQQHIHSPSPLNAITKLLLAGVTLICLVVLILAFVAAPSTWDAMEYHLPRTILWMSDHNVRFFATPDYSQLIFGPWAEYAMMHANLLWGSDRFVNFVEFFAMLGSIVGASLIAKQLGAGVRGQAFAAIAAATIPEGILEASGPMNTWVVSFWMVTIVLFLLLWIEQPDWWLTACVGLSAGIAVLTKGTAYIYLPFMVLTCWCAGRSAAKIRFLKLSPLFLALIVLVNAPQYYRAYGLTGSPLGLPFPDGGPRLHWMVDRFSLQDAAANVVRNASLHLVTPSPRINGKINAAVRSVIWEIGRDPDDPKTTWPNSPFESNHFSMHEIHAGDPLHFFLLLVALAAAFLFPRKLASIVRWYALGIIFSFLTFCTLLRWQTWASRHHLVIFLFGAALVGVVLERAFPQRVASAIAILLVLYALPFAFLNRTRSLIRWAPVFDVYHSRDLLYFADMHEKYAAANIAAAAEINQLGCDAVAIDSYTPKPGAEIAGSPRSFFVYPILAMIHADGRTRTVWYSGVTNWSSRYALTQSHPAPCAVLCLDCADKQEKWEKYQSVGGRATVHDYIVVFSANGQVVNPVSSGATPGQNSVP